MKGGSFNRVNINLLPVDVKGAGPFVTAEIERSQYGIFYFDKFPEKKYFFLCTRLPLPHAMPWCQLAAACAYFCCAAFESPWKSVNCELESAISNEAFGVPRIFERRTITWSFVLSGANKNS